MKKRILSLLSTVTLAVLTLVGLNACDRNGNAVARHQNQADGR